jgi:hypothetical protein
MGLDKWGDFKISDFEISSGMGMWGKKTSKN